MKKTYKNPEMNISVFDAENIVTGSSQTAAEYARANMEEIFNQKAESVTALIVF